jgi:hypothetical protein
MTPDRIRSLIGDFNKAAVSTTFQEVDRLVDDAEPGLVLSVLARIDEKALETTDRLRDAANRFLDRATAEVVSKLRVYDASFEPEHPPGADGATAVQAMAAEIDALLAGLDDAAKQLAVAEPRRSAQLVSGGSAS